MDPFELSHFSSSHVFHEKKYILALFQWSIQVDCKVLYLSISPFIFNSFNHECLSFCRSWNGLKTNLKGTTAIYHECLFKMSSSSSGIFTLIGNNGLYHSNSHHQSRIPKFADFHFYRFVEKPRNNSTRWSRSNSISARLCSHGHCSISKGKETSKEGSAIILRRCVVFSFECAHRIKHKLRFSWLRLDFQKNNHILDWIYDQQSNDYPLSILSRGNM